MRKGDRLCSLKVGVAGHYHVLTVFRLRKYCPHKLLQKLGNSVDLVTQIKTEVKGNLIVSASCGVKLLSYVAYALGKLRLNKHMDKFNDVDILVGYNSDEGASFSFGANGADTHKASVIERYGPFAEALLEAYPVDGPVVTKTGRDLARDASFGWHTWTWARLQAEKGQSNVYLYYFDQHPEYPEDSPKYGSGSPHGQDVDFVFKALKSEDADTDFELSDIMATYWTNFAKYGDPNGEGLPVWPEFTTDNHVTMVLKGDSPYPAPVPDEDAMWILDEYFKWLRAQ